MDPQGKVDTGQFSAMCHQLSTLTGVPYLPVLKAETTSVLQRWLQLVPAASAGPILRRWAEAIFTAQPDSLYTPQTRAGIAARSRAARSKNGKLKYFLFNRYPTELWSKIQARRLASAEAKIKAIGLAKQSVLQIAEKLGVQIAAPGYVRKASAYGKDHPENTTVRVASGKQTAQIDISNAQPTINLPRLGGRRALITAINGRVKFFATNAEKAVFADVAKIARQYKGIKVVQRG